MNATGNEGTGIRVIPPLVFAAALAIAAVAGWLWPLGFVPGDARFWLGAIVMIASLAVTPPVLMAFRRAKTPFDVRRAANTLVTDGPYRYSRNPGYVAMIALCLGIAILADNGWMLIAVAIAARWIHRHVVLAEERHLETRFGDEYRAYKNRVRRWL